MDSLHLWLGYLKKNMMKPSKYILNLNRNNELYSYSTINGSLIKHPCAIANLNDIDNVSAKVWLQTNHFLVEDCDDEVDYLKKAYRKRLTEFDSTLYITVEITTACNFRCSFCYQASWGNRQRIKNSTIDQLIRLLRQSNILNYNTLHLNIIGGEPMLFPDTVEYLIQTVSEFCSTRGLTFEIKLNSNGYGLTKNFLHKCFHNGSFMFPFLSPYDYSSGIVIHKRSTINFRNELIEKIQAWKDVFNESKKRKIIFRYNVNENNISYFDQYVDEIISFGYNNYLIEVVNTADCDFNHYKNQLTQKEFDDWYYTVAIPIFRKKNLTIPIKPRCELSRCKARRSGSFKLFADGRIGLCNGIEYDPSKPLIDNIKSLDDINILYKDIKSFHYILHDNLCIKCEKVFLCGGPSPCKGRVCRGNIKNVLKYVEAFVK